MLVVGADVWKRGWVAVAVDSGDVTGITTFDGFDDLATEHSAAAVIGIDIPIGLPDDPPRRADVLAKAFVGPRASSVFHTPPRDVLEAPTYRQALKRSYERYGGGISAQSYALRKRIFEVDAVRGDTGRLIEVHPEVSFRALTGAPLEHSKKTWNGQMERRTLLAGAGLHLPDRITGSAGRIPVDDILDATAVAWSAGRWATNRAEAIPDGAEPSADQTIWY